MSIPSSPLDHRLRLKRSSSLSRCNASEIVPFFDTLLHGDRVTDRQEKRQDGEKDMQEKQYMQKEVRGREGVQLSLFRSITST